MKSDIGGVIPTWALNKLAPKAPVDMMNAILDNYQKIDSSESLAEYKYLIA